MPKSTDPADRETYLSAAAESDRAAAEAQAAVLRYLARTILAHDPAATELRVDVDPASKDSELRPGEILIGGRAAAYDPESLDPDLWSACEHLKPGQLFDRYARRDPSVRSAYLIDLNTAKDATPDADPFTAPRRPNCVHPAGCGCNDCGEGESIALDRASEEQVAAMVRGELRDISASDLEITVVVRNRNGNPPFTYTYEPSQLGMTINSQR